MVFVSINKLSCCNAGRAGKIEPLSIFTVAAAQLLQFRQGMFLYSLKCPRQGPGSNRRQCTGGLRLYGNQPKQAT